MGLVGVVKTEVAMLTFEHFPHYPMVATRLNKGVCHFDVASCVISVLWCGQVVLWDLEKKERGCIAQWAT